MEDGEHREAIIGQFACQIEHLQPVVEVEVAHRLIEQQHLRLGGERLGEGEALQVAAGQRVDGLVGEMLGIGEVHRAAHGFTVRRAGPAEPRQVRMSTHLHELGGREREGRAHLLRHHADERCALQRSHRCQRDAADSRARLQLRVARDRPKQRGLAGSVGPHEAHDLAGRHRELGVRYDRLACIADGRAVVAQQRLSAAHTRSPFTSSHRKKGPPISAVTIPTGSPRARARCER